MADFPLIDYNGAEFACLRAANASPKLVALDAKTSLLARTWKPTGFYTIADIRGIINEIEKQTIAASASVALTRNVTGDRDARVREAQRYLIGDESHINSNKKRIAAYRALIADVERRGLKIVDAPGLKDAVLKMMNNISQAYTTRAAIDCRANVLDDAAEALGKIYDAAGSVVGYVADLAVAAGEAAAGAAKSVFKVMTVLKWVAIIGGPVLGGLWAYSRWNEYVAKQRAFRSEDETVRIAAVERAGAQREQARIAKTLKAQTKAARLPKSTSSASAPKAKGGSLPPAAALISPVANS
jgi:hypothetical protein